jgi:1-acyl-sn-glycerol-3-phosphate acyltransferase
MRVQAWASRLLQLLGIELRVRGRPVTQGPALVCNHISWLDIVVLHAAGTAASSPSPRCGAGP